MTLRVVLSLILEHFDANYPLVDTIFVDMTRRVVQVDLTPEYETHILVDVHFDLVGYQMRGCAFDLRVFGWCKESLHTVVADYMRLSAAILRIEASNRAASGFFAC